MIKREAGSAYILTLLILVILTLLGLSLALITSTEMQVGANERLTERVFYASDSGIAIGAAQILVRSDYSEGDFPVNDAYGTPAGLVSNNVFVGPLIPILEAPCHLCDINRAGDYAQGDRYFRYNMAIPSRGERAALNSMAQRRVIASIEVQPWQEIPLDPYLEVDKYTKDELAEKVKF